MDDTLLVLGDTYELPVTRDEAALSSGVWILSVVVAGRIWRWASEEVEIDTDDGATIRIVGGLQIGPEEQADITQLDGSEMSVSASKLMPQGDIAALVEAGHELDDIPAEVALWYPGRTWEKRVVLLRGWTWLPEYGTVDEDIALTVESPEYQEQGVLLDPQGRVGIPTLGEKGSDKAEGRVYPLVLGKPDWVPATIYGLVGNDAVVAVGQVQASTVVLARVEDGTTTSVNENPEPRSYLRDSFGQWVSTVDYTAGIALGTLGFGDTMEIISRWNNTGTNGGGLLNEHRDGYVTGLGDVVRWAMRRSTIPIDEGRWRAVEDHLNRWLIDFWTNDPKLTPWEFVRDTLLPLVPVSILHGPRGLYPVWWNYQPGGGAHERAAEVDVQASGLSRVGRVQFERRDRPVNEISIEFYPWQGDLFRHSLTYTGVPEARDGVIAGTVGSERVVQTALLRAAYSRQRGQRRAAPVMQTRALYQRPMVAQTLNWKQYAMCRAFRAVTYDDMRGRWAWLRTGSVVQLVDDELGIDRLAWVRRRQFSVGGVRLQFLLWDHE